ncbi:glycerophosphodiester phosphodiesterase family protein [Pelagibacterium xiamenense]|uniref:glycerophosphodiester phosphodiesterase family protein n=1 Tax=Pelagibacterium xiamenense TaxID=2901140 RepID=UPI001E477421|nr:glycerophosphodiester phosphodiesterase family protein [Pelagibacterium xiamenense]MCD7061179.1 glycerophosphodiester phosphodiesterase [Pelagibacterium xiamenense]
MHSSPFDQPIAHRGLHNREEGVIENSASAFEAAIARGFAIECDLQLTSDGEAVVFHDHDLERLTGRSGPIHAVTAGEIAKTPLLLSKSGDCPQTFEAFLAQIAGRTPLVVEIKHQPNASARDALAKRAVALAKAYTGPLAFKSFDPHTLKAVRDAGYTGPLGIVTYAYRKPEWDGEISPLQRFVLRHLLHWPVSRFTFVSCERTALALPAIRLCRALGTKVMSWTIRDKAHVPAVLRQADQIVFEGFDPGP